MPELAYVNGAYMPLAEATISVEDRGFQFADAVYEVIATCGGIPYAVSEHMQLRAAVPARWCSIRKRNLPLFA